MLNKMSHLYKWGYIAVAFEQLSQTFCQLWCMTENQLKSGNSSDVKCPMFDIK